MKALAVKRCLTFTTALASIVLVVGCGGGEGERPNAPSSSAQDADQELKLPQRPRDLPVAGLPEPQICEIFKPDQLAQLGVGDGSPSAKNGTRDLPGCTWLSAPASATSIGVMVGVAPTSVQELQKQSVEGSPETAASYTVGGGFGAVQSQIPGAENLGCTVDVDAAEGQTLEASLSWLGGEEMNNQDMCAKAKQAAEFAVTNLQAQG